MLSDDIRIMTVPHFASGRTVALERRNEIADKVDQLEQRIEELEKERDEWHAVADRHLKEKNALITADFLAQQEEA